MSTTTATRGTVKVGRWTYPAELDPDGRVTRNTKRDGSGEWDVVSLVDRDRFVPDAPTANDDTVVVEIPGFVDEAPVNHDREDLRTANRVVFANFAATLDEVAEAVDTNPGRAKSLLNELAQLGLVASTTVNDDKELVWQSAETYDFIDEATNDAKFEEAVPADIKVRAVSSHGGKVGAQTKKPGRSTWQVGDKCPQGHTITDAEGDNPVYVQPSGRKQCRKCRGGYASNS